MNDSIWQIIASTPWWVYALFFYLLRMGFLATKPRIVSLQSLIILPVILLIGSILSLFYQFTLHIDHIAIWLGGLLLGTAVGSLQYRLLRIRALKSEQKLYISGSWSLLIIIGLIFATKYYFGYQIEVNPNLFAQKAYLLKVVLLYGLFTGFFIGRLAYALRCIKYGPFFEAPLNQPGH